MKTQHDYWKEDDDRVWREINMSKWRQWVAWRPVHVKGNWYWLTTIYRRWDCTLVHNGRNGRNGSWQYGDMFEVLKG